MHQDYSEGVVRIKPSGLMKPRLVRFGQAPALR